MDQLYLLQIDQLVNSLHTDLEDERIEISIVSEENKYNDVDEIMEMEIEIHRK